MKPLRLVLFNYQQWMDTQWSHNVKHNWCDFWTLLLLNIDVYVRDAWTIYLSFYFIRSVIFFGFIAKSVLGTLCCLFFQDSNLGLVKQCITSIYKKNIQRLTKVPCCLHTKNPIATECCHSDDSCLTIGIYHLSDVECIMFLRVPWTVLPSNCPGPLGSFQVLICIYFGFWSLDIDISLKSSIWLACSTL